MSFHQSYFIFFKFITCFKHKIPPINFDRISRLRILLPFGVTLLLLYYYRNPVEITIIYSFVAPMGFEPTN